MRNDASKKFYMLKLGHPDAKTCLVQIRNARLELLGLAQSEDSKAIASFFGISKLKQETIQFVKALYPGQIQAIQL